MLYIGSQSESHIANLHHGHGIAFGGGGFAISAPLARALSSTMDTCIARYPDLETSDMWVAACAAELGVSLTIERGFHQARWKPEPVSILYRFCSASSKNVLGKVGGNTQTYIDMQSDLSKDSSSHQANCSMLHISRPVLNPSEPTLAEILASFEWFMETLSGASSKAAGKASF
jgi:hypothetical protein